MPSRNGPSPMRVVGRTVLSSKHSVYLLEVGERVLIVGTGAQGPLRSSGNSPKRADREPRLSREPGASTVSVPIGPAFVSGRFDRRVGDDE